MRALMLLLMALLMLPLVAAAPYVSPETVDNRFLNAQEATIEYLVSDTVPVDNCSLIIDSSIIQTDLSIMQGVLQSFTETLSETSYTWQISCTNNNSETTITDARTLTVDITLPGISLNAPADNVMLSYDDVTFSYTPADTNLEECSLFTNESGWNIRAKDSAVVSGWLNDMLISMPDGEHLWAVECADKAGNKLAVGNRTLFTDSTPPEITDYSPKGSVTSELTTLYLETNENATCRFSDNSASNFSDMTEFAVTGKTIHSKTITVSEGSQNYYIKCEDTIGHVTASVYHISFEVKLLPTAEVQMSDISPIKAGVIEVTLLTSKNMDEEPYLAYSLDSGSHRQVPLTGEDSLWTGYMIIRPEDDNQVGTFYFSGTDTDGNTGTIVTDGKLFLVDTSQPSIPINLEATSLKNGDIQMEWFFDGPDVEYYEIYRSTTPGVNYIDFYGTVNGTLFTDTSAEDMVTYYYKVAIMDTAGNRGQLSDEVYATSETGSSSSSKPVTNVDDETPKVLPPALVPLVDISMKQADSLLIDLEEAEKNLQETSDTAKSELIAELGILEEIGRSKSTIESVKARLEALKDSYSTQGELETDIKNIELDSKKVRQATPIDVSIMEQAEFIQGLNDEIIEEAMAKFLEGTITEESDTKDYEKLNKKLQEKVKVEISVKLYTIEYLDKVTQDNTLIKKNIIYEDPESLSDIFVMEMIPKTVVESAGDIELLTSGYEIVENDPVLKWGFFELGFEGKTIKYIIHATVPVEEVKKSKSVVLTAFNDYSMESSKVTGFSVGTFFKDNFGFGKLSSLFVWLGLSTIVLLGVYYFFFVREEMEFPKIFAKNIKGAQPEVTEGAYKQDSYLLLNDMYDHINNLEGDISDKLYPMIADINKRLGDGHKKGDVEKLIKLNSLISEAHFCLQNRQEYEARLLYPKVKLIYQGLPTQFRSEVYGKCLDLHKKIKDSKKL
ncbi:MAG: hypothetical protein GY861_27140 [bacterium]|nr:hypothetical protein [bacterium]